MGEDGRRHAHLHLLSARAGGAARGGLFLPLLLAGAAMAAVPAAAGPEESPEAAARAWLETRSLRQLAELAQGKDYYLVLDAAGGRLSLMYQGVTLREYPVLRADVGRPRFVYAGLPPPDDWSTRVWTGGQLEPPREVQRYEVAISVKETTATPDSLLPDPVIIPPTPEEACPTPELFRVRFDGGLSLVFHLREADDNLPLWGRLWAFCVTRAKNVSAALWADDKDSLRLKISLPPEEIESLYRSLPPDVKFTLLPAGPGA